MTENCGLLQQIKKLGLTEEQAIKALAVAASFAKEKFPILQGNINSYIKQELKQADPYIVERVFDDNSFSL